MKVLRSYINSMFLKIIVPLIIFSFLCANMIAQPLEDEEELQSEGSNLQAIQAWEAYDYAVRAAQVEYEAKMHAWREAMEAYNQSNGELPHPGPMPGEIDIPPTPPMPRP